MNVSLNESVIAAARAKLGLILDRDLERMAKRLKRETGKGSSFAQRDNLAAQIAIAQELAARNA